MCQRNQVYLKIFCTKSSQTSTYFFPFSITPSDSLPPPSSSFPFPSNEHSHQKGLCFLLNLEYLVFRHLISKKIQNYLLLIIASSVQFSSVTQSCPTLCNSMNCSTPDLPVHHQLPEFTQTHVHRVGDVIQPSHPLSSPSPPAPNPSQDQGFFQ